MLLLGLGQARRLRHRTDPLLRPLEPGPEPLGSLELPQNRTRRQLLPLVLGPQLPELPQLRELQLEPQPPHRQSRTPHRRPQAPEQRPPREPHHQRQTHPPREPVLHQQPELRQLEPEPEPERRQRRTHHRPPPLGPGPASPLRS